MTHLTSAMRLSLRWTPVVAAALLAAGCANPSLKAPVEDRRAPVGKPAVEPAKPVEAAAAPVAPVAKPLPGAENAGKPGYYTVQRGDTLIRIALDNGQNWRDVARWNQLDNPNVIEVGQVLRVVSPQVDPTVAAARPVAAAGKVESRPLEVSKPNPNGGTAPAAVGSAPATVVPAAPAVAQAPREGDESVDWQWPAQGPVGAAFDEGKNKGLAITGKAGDPVYAAADGRVVYAGAALRGYGNLVIIKHNNTFLTAYGHNQALLVKEEQAVRRGQKIAEMGNSEAERVQLHFEIRRRGVPVDPSKLLPVR